MATSAGGAVTGVVSVTPVPLQTAFTIFSLISTTLQGSEPEPAPLYLKPLLPAGLPRPFQPAAGSEYVLEFIGSPRSLISSDPPAVVGSSAPVGSVKAPFEITFASEPGFTIMILPGMSWSAASAGVAHTATSAAPTNIFLRLFCISPPFG